MLQDMFVAFILVAAAEMGDKSQVLAMTFATRYSIGQVLIGISIGALLNHGIAVALGSSLTKFIALDTIRITAGAAFVLFAFLTLIKQEDSLEQIENRKYAPVITIATAFFIGELGDKTQLTAITLAGSAENPLFVLIGTVSAMIITSSIGILVGSRMGNRMPEFSLKIISALVFLFFGLTALYRNIPPIYLTPLNLFVVILVLGLVTTFLIRRAGLLHHQPSMYKTRAEHLSKVYELLNDPNFNLVKAREALCLTIAECENCHNRHRANCAIHTTRRKLEMICFNKTLPFSGNLVRYLDDIEQESLVLAARIRKMIATKKN